MGFQNKHFIKLIVEINKEKKKGKKPLILREPNCNLLDTLLNLILLGIEEATNTLQKDVQPPLVSRLT